MHSVLIIRHCTISRIWHFGADHFRDQIPQYLLFVLYFSITLMSIFDITKLPKFSRFYSQIAFWSTFLLMLHSITSNMYLSTDFTIFTGWHSQDEATFQRSFSAWPLLLAKSLGQDNNGFLMRHFPQLLLKFGLHFNPRHNSPIQINTTMTPANNHYFPLALNISSYFIPLE